MTLNDNGFPATRRLILQGAAWSRWSASAICRSALRRRWPRPTTNGPEDAFKQKSEADAIKALYGKTAEPSDKVKLDAPEIAENGAVVPISVATTLDRRDLDLASGRRQSERAGGVL